jgi:hypothetical protein
VARCRERHGPRWLLGLFLRPAHAIRFTLEVANRVRDLVIEVSAEMHTGECEFHRGQCGGLTSRSVCEP